MSALTINVCFFFWWWVKMTRLRLRREILLIYCRTDISRLVSVLALNLKTRVRLPNMIKLMSVFRFLKVFKVFLVLSHNLAGGSIKCLLNDKATLLDIRIQSIVNLGFLWRWKRKLRLLKVVWTNSHKGQQKIF